MDKLVDQYFFQNNEEGILATSSDVDLTTNTVSWNYLIHAYIKRDKELPLLYLDLSAMVDSGYKLEIQKIYNFAKFIVEEFPFNSWVFNYQQEKFTIMTNDKKLNGRTPSFIVLPFIKDKLNN